MKVILMLLLTFNVFAEDTVIKKLESENQLLLKQVERNNRIISERQKSQHELIEKSQSKEASTNQLSFGFETYDWGQVSLIGDAPTIAYSTSVNSFSFEGSYGRLQQNDFPTYGTQTLANIYKLTIKYDLTFHNDSFSFRPLAGYVNILVNSPDAGLVDNQELAEQERQWIEDIENRSGIFYGMELAYHFHPKWNVSGRVEFNRTTSLSLGYRL